MADSFRHDEPQEDVGSGLTVDIVKVEIICSRNYGGAIKTVVLHEHLIHIDLLQGFIKNLLKVLQSARNVYVYR